MYEESETLGRMHQKRTPTKKLEVDTANSRRYGVARPIKQGSCHGLNGPNLGKYSS